MTTRSHARARRQHLAARVAWEREVALGAIAWDAIVAGELRAQGWTDCTQCDARLESEADVGRLEVYARSSDGVPIKVRLLCVRCAAAERLDT